MFAMERLAHRVTLLENSKVAERSRVIIHSDPGPYVVGCWYHPPAPGQVDTTRSFKKGQLHAANAVGCVVLGDLNVHHRKWLKLSNRNSLEGQELCAVCKELDLTQLVPEPTCGEHLLDLVLSNFPGVATLGLLGALTNCGRSQGVVVQGRRLGTAPRLAC